MIYTTGSIAVSGSTLTGTGTNFKAPLSMIRVGCTVIVKSDPIQIFAITEIVSETELSVTPEASPDIPAGTDYSILLCDSISVDGLAQDVAEALRYFTGQESEISAAVEFMKEYDIESAQALAAAIKTETEKSTANATACAVAAQTATNAATEATEQYEAAKTAKEAAESARDQANTYATSATSAATAAGNAATSAQTAQTAAEAARDEAATQATAAGNAATSAQTAQTAAEAARDEATSQATAATNAATSAAESAAKASECVLDTPIPVSKGGTGQTTDSGVKAYIESLGFSTSSGSTSTGTSTSQYEVTQATFDFAAPTCGITFASYSEMSNIPTSDYLESVLLGNSDEDISTVSSSNSFAILECVKIATTDGSTVYSLRVTRIPYKSTYSDYSYHARCYGIGVLGTDNAISWGFRQDYW